ncbi:MAG: hypothetical protein ACRCW7_05510 [Cetobacterium sp.]
MAGAGWSLKSGKININSSVETAIYKFFSKGNQMQNLYKLLLLQSLIDIEEVSGEVFNEVAIGFSEIYFNYKAEYKLNMTIYNGRSKKSDMDILIEKFHKEKIYNYTMIPIEEKVDYIISVREILKKNVIGAFYKSLNELPYEFNTKEEILIINSDFKKFLDKNKDSIENLIFYRSVEFFKISEKDEGILNREMTKKGILDYKQNFYIQIENMIRILFE